MQGRLTRPDGDRLQAFPRLGWESEFALASAAGLDCIEWIYDTHGEAVNPLSSSAGVRRMRALSEEHGVAVSSLCADWLMENVPFGHAERWTERLGWLIARCAAGGIRRIVIPFVDSAGLTGSDRMREAASVVSRALGPAERHDIELHLETSLAPAPFAELLSKLPDPLVRVNYDSGNSASLGFDPSEEFAAYGSRIGSFHVKDRLRGGASVPLGTGAAQLDVVFGLLDKVGYGGDAILQAARGEPGRELEWAQQNVALVRAQYANVA